MHVILFKITQRKQAYDPRGCLQYLYLLFAYMILFLVKMLNDPTWLNTKAVKYRLYMSVVTTLNYYHHPSPLELWSSCMFGVSDGMKHCTNTIWGSQREGSVTPVWSVSFPRGSETSAAHVLTTSSCFPTHSQLIWSVVNILEDAEAAEALFLLTKSPQ